MPSSWVIRRESASGPRYLVRFRVGGRESAQFYGGSFKRQEDARARKRYIDGQLAALRVPDLKLIEQKPVQAPALAEAERGWRKSRVDVVEQTANMHRSAFARIFKTKPELRSRRVDELTIADVAGADEDTSSDAKFGLSWHRTQSVIILICLRESRRQVRSRDPLQFDLTDLSLFRHVVEAGSITHGAERAHLALAAASTRIRNMERSLGAPLLRRTRQGVIPTPAGRTLVQHARAMLAQADRLREDLGAFTGGLAGQIRILSNTNALTEFLPESLSAFLARHPQVTIDLEEKLSDEIVGLIAEGVGDIGIVAGTVDTGRLETYPFRSDRFVLVVPQGHALAGQGSAGQGSAGSSAGHGEVAFAEVLGNDFVGLDRASALQRFLADKAGRIGRPLRLRVQLRSFDAVCRMVEAGVGLGVVPETTARRAARTMAITAVDLKDPWAVRDLTLCVRALKDLAPSARQLVEHLRRPD